jgi:hypothetical protein
MVSLGMVEDLVGCWLGCVTQNRNNRPVYTEIQVSSYKNRNNTQPESSYIHPQNRIQTKIQYVHARIEIIYRQYIQVYASHRMKIHTWHYSAYVEIIQTEIIQVYASSE